MVKYQFRSEKWRMRRDRFIQQRAPVLYENFCKRTSHIRIRMHERTAAFDSYGKLNVLITTIGCHCS